MPEWTEGVEITLAVDFGLLDRLRLLVRGHIDVTVPLFLAEAVEREYERPEVQVRGVWEDTGTEWLLEEGPWTEDEEE